MRKLKFKDGKSLAQGFSPVSAWDNMTLNLSLPLSGLSGPFCSTDHIDGGLGNWFLNCELFFPVKLVRKSSPSTRGSEIALPM
jgi:hypothetical protein